MRALCSVLLWLVLCGFACAADWTHVQSIGTKPGLASSFNSAFSATVGVGSVVVGSVTLGAGIHVNSITDDKSNTYVLTSSNDDGTLYTTGFRSSGLLTNAPKTLTIAASGSSALNWVVQSEFTPPTGTTSITTDGTVSTSIPNGTNLGSFTPVNNDTLNYAGGSTGGSACTAGSGWTMVVSDSPVTQQFAEWRIQVTAGSVSVTITNPSNVNVWSSAFGVAPVFAGGANPSLRSLTGVGK